MAVLGIASKSRGVKLNSSDYRQSRRLVWHGKNPGTLDFTVLCDRTKRETAPRRLFVVATFTFWLHSLVG